MSWMQWMGDCIHVFTATDHQKNALKKLIVWCITDCVSSYISIWTDDHIILFECIQNMNFLCYRVTTFSVFSISLSLSLFFPKVQKLRCTLYTGTHCMVHKCWLVRKRKTGYFRHQFIEALWEAKYIVSSTEWWTFFFLFIGQELEKSYLYCFGVPNYLLL
mgnify:CR=1 FL=1